MLSWLLAANKFQNGENLCELMHLDFFKGMRKIVSDPENSQGTTLTKIKRLHYVSPFHVSVSYLNNTIRQTKIKHFTVSHLFMYLYLIWTIPFVVAFKPIFYAPPMRVHLHKSLYPYPAWTILFVVRFQLKFCARRMHVHLHKSMCLYPIEQYYLLQCSNLFCACELAQT